MLEIQQEMKRGNDSTLVLTRCFMAKTLFNENQEVTANEKSQNITASAILALYMPFSPMRLKIEDPRLQTFFHESVVKF